MQLGIGVMWSKVWPPLVSDPSDAVSWLELTIARDDQSISGYLHEFSELREMTRVFLDISMNFLNCERWPECFWISPWIFWIARDDQSTEYFWISPWIFWIARDDQSTEYFWISPWIFWIARDDQSVSGYLHEFSVANQEPFEMAAGALLHFEVRSWRIDELAYGLKTEPAFCMFLCLSWG